MQQQVPLEIERKYLVRMPELSLLRALGGEGEAIEQTYLLSEAGVTERVRRRRGAGGSVCTHTVKKRISALSREEREEVIDEEAYLTLLRRADPGLQCIRKRRYSIPMGDFLLEIDVFPFWEDRCLAEVELPSEAVQPRLPDWLEVIREVSEDGQYTNRALAARIPHEDPDSCLRSWAEVSLGAIRHNYRLLRSLLPADCGCVGVVKADAYGHGAVEVARLLEAEGCPLLAVACLAEGLELRRAGITLPILVLGPTPAQKAEALREAELMQAVGSPDYARALSQTLRGPLRCHMKLDTGMSRTGFDWRSDAAAEEALRLPQLVWEGAFTHFSCADDPGADDFTREQYRRFLAATEGRGFRLRHCLNSAALLRFPEFHLDLARPGILLYGNTPLEGEAGIPVRQAMSLKSRVAAITLHKAGDKVSYGGSFVCQRDMRIAVLPIGYGDGLHRCLSGKLEVELCGRRAKQLGRICMDLCMVDITELPDCRVGDVATVFSPALPLGPLSALAGTIPYELTCAVTARIPRVYTE